MMAEKRMVPEVRFAGFEGAWKTTQLGELVSIVGGGTPDTSNPAFWGGDIDWYSPTEIGSVTYAEGSNKKITSSGLEKSGAKMLPGGRTVLFTSRAGIGHMAILRRSGTTNQGFQSFVMKDGTDTYYIYSAGHLITAYAMRNASGSTFLEISGKLLADMPMPVPRETEQARVGSFFKYLDNLIAAQQRKVDKLAVVKKAMLEKMFPKDGANVPEIRFAGFSGAWERRRLSTLMDFSNGINAPKESYGKGRRMISVLDVLSPSPIIYDKIKSAVSVDSKVEKSNMVESGDIAFVRSSEIVDEVGWAKAYLEKEYALFSGFIIRGKKKSEFDSRFVELSLNYSQRKQIERNTGGSTRFNISQSIIASVDIPMPNYAEQSAIGTYFHTLDRLTTLQTQKLAKLKTIKQALLAKMFV